VLDCVGTTSTLTLAAQVARPEGDIALVGAGGGSYAVTWGSLPLDCTLRTPYWGSAVELTEVLELSRSGAIRARTCSVSRSTAPQTRIDSSTTARSTAAPSSRRTAPSDRLALRMEPMR
jgi:alcohol dehydrogenase, propanol-preferring